jgi:hypothetical protein
MLPTTLAHGIFSMNNNWKGARSVGASKTTRRTRRDSFRQVDVESIRKLTGQVNLDSADFTILQYFRHKLEFRLSGFEPLHT